MIANQVLEMLSMEDFAHGSDMRLLAEVVGLDVMKQILANLGGMQLYISRSAATIAAERYIKRNRKLGAKQLALDTDMSLRQVYEVFAAAKLDEKTESLFVD